MKLKLTKVVRTEKDKNGNPYTTKDGRAYTRLGIQAQEYGQRWLSGFDGYQTKDWKEGDTVEVDVEQTTKVDAKGQPFMNFKVPKKFEVTQAMWEMMCDQVANLQKNMGAVPPEEEPEIDPDSIPF